MHHVSVLLTLHWAALGHSPKEIRTLVMAEGMDGLAKLVWTLQNVVLDQQASKTFLCQGNTQEAEGLLSECSC